MTAPSTGLVVGLALLAADATIELGFVTSMVSYLHAGAPSGAFVVNNGPGTYVMAGKPLHMLVDQGHTSNGAAGTALVLIGIVGTLALVGRWRYPGKALTRFLYYFWLVAQVPALLLTLAALAYVFAVTNKHKNQTIDQSVFSGSSTGSSGGSTVYPLDQWTPQNWFAAVLAQLDLADPNLRSDLTMHLHIMRGWQYNLIPMLLLQIAETALAFMDFMRWRRSGGGALGSSFGHGGHGAINRGSHGSSNTYDNGNDYNTAREKYSGDYNNNNSGIVNHGNVNQGYNSVHQGGYENNNSQGYVNNNNQGYSNAPQFVHQQ